MGGNGAAMKRGGGGGGGKVSLKGSMKFLTGAYGSEHAKEVVAILSQAPKSIQMLYEKYSDKFMASDEYYPTSPKADFNPWTEKVRLGIEYVAAGDNMQNPYETMFHEYGHAIDYFIGKENSSNGNVISFSDSYIDAVTGKTIGDTAKKEAEDIIKLSKMRHGVTRKPEAIDKFITDVYHEHGWNIKKLGNLSDILEGAGFPNSPFGAGHGASYWKTRGNNKETFANILEAVTANKESLYIIKEYLPETYDVFERMIEERTKL